MTAEDGARPTAVEGTEPAAAPLDDRDDNDRVADGSVAVGQGGVGRDAVGQNNIGTQERPESPGSLDAVDGHGRPGAPITLTVTAPGSYFTWAFGLAAGGLSAYFLVRVIAHAESVLTVVLLSAFLAVSLNPIVTALTEQRRIPMRRGPAVLVVGLGVAGLVAGFLAVIVPPVANEVTQLIHAIPHVLQQIQDKSTFLGRIEAKYHVVSKV